MSAHPVPDPPVDDARPPPLTRLECTLPIACAWGLGLVLVSLLVLPAPLDATGTPRWTGAHVIAILSAGLVGPRQGAGGWAGLFDGWHAAVVLLETGFAAMAVLRRSGTAVLAFLTIFLPRILLVLVVLLAGCD